MEEKHFTPGPWEVVDDDHHELGTDSSVLIESTSRGITLAIIGPGDATTYTEDMVNAQLFAAAPELLEALIQLKAHVEDRYWGEQSLWDLSDHPMKLAYDAIAKALGKE
jgi:hypothetical protein